MVKKTGTSKRKKTGKKALAGTKKAARKKAVKKPAAKRASVRKAGKKAAVKRTLRTPARAGGPKLSKAPVSVEPGPPSGAVPPVEEPAPREEAIGIVTHYYSHLGVAVVQVTKDALRTGDRIRIKGHSTDFTQLADSLEYEHQHVDEVAAGMSAGLKVIDHARQHDIVYRLS